MSAQLTNAPQPQNLTLWVWPTGLYPRRIMFYLKAKALNGSITLSTLSTNLKIIPVTLDMKSGSLASPPDHEPRPPNTTVPVLRISHTDPAQDEYIYHSTSILAYLEAVFPSPTHSLLGNTPIETAQVADMVQQINESLLWVNVYVRHGTAASLTWSGMSASEQSASAAADAMNNWKKCTKRLDEWINPEPNTIHVASGPSAADFVLMAIHDYVWEMYQWDCFEGCERLQNWVRRVQQQPGADWYMTKPQLERVEKEGFEILFE